LTTLDRHRRDWEDLAEIDPLWAILASPETRGGRWDVDAFFASGEAEIAEVLRSAETLGYPRRRERALDFGCGVGRLTRALSESFDDAVGLDISVEMIRLARELNDGRPCRFEVNDRGDLGGLEPASFDFVYSSLVLQHMPSTEVIRSYIGEFLRVVRPDGLIVFQSVEHLPRARRIQPRRRVYSVLRRLGLPHDVLVEKLRLVPVRMTAISQDDVRRTVAARGGVIERVEGQPEPADGARSVRYYVRPA
jgi:SAM-dependent methyltransferase